MISSWLYTMNWAPLDTCLYCSLLPFTLNSFEDPEVWASLETIVFVPLWIRDPTIMGSNMDQAKLLGFHLAGKAILTWWKRWFIMIQNGQRRTVSYLRFTYYLMQDCLYEMRYPPHVMKYSLRAVILSTNPVIWGFQVSTWDRFYWCLRVPNAVSDVKKAWKHPGSAWNLTPK